MTLHRPSLRFGSALRLQRLQYVEETRRQQQEQNKAAALAVKPFVDPLKHAPRVHVEKVYVAKKTRSPESLAAARLRVDSDSRFYKEKLLDLAIQSRSWMREASSVDKAIDAAFSSPPSDFPAAILYSRAARFNEKHNLVRNKGEGAVTATHDSNILSKDAFDADGSNRS